MLRDPVLEQPDYEPLQTAASPAVGVYIGTPSSVTAAQMARTISLLVCSVGTGLAAYDDGSQGRGIGAIREPAREDVVPGVEATWLGRPSARMEWGESGLPQTALMSVGPVQRTAAVRITSAKGSLGQLPSCTI
ncbi:hypothetical protein R1flu_016875 [Riccia fluitans]|uniref:Uncharacterized protein n=1 Tax=Riccia fluitans TaxID=41844 RepID=A0ABD1YP32_9MARC